MKIKLLVLCGFLALVPLAWADRVDDELLQQAYQQQRSDLQVKGVGTVFKLLADDNRGSRHQRFIIRLASGQTLLVAHNIDLAPKIENLKVGDEISFFGEYEWSNKGGTVHWTHHDPRGRHVSGWLKHAARVYQ
jgi:hypothetical protein